MSITIHEIRQDNLHDAGRCDSLFNVDSKLVVSAEDKVIRYTIISIEPYVKRYSPEKVDYTAYIHNDSMAAFFAYVDGAIAGEIRLRHNWNRYAFLEEIVVDNRFRRCGVGKALMQKGVEWARKQGLPGIIAETQDNNVAACRFYESCGFELGGFDRFLYKGDDASAEEAALFWYLLF